jgi:hypothetical protein
MTRARAKHTECPWIRVDAHVREKRAVVRLASLAPHRYRHAMEDIVYFYC